MRTLRGTAHGSILQAAAQVLSSVGAARRAAPKYARPLLAALMAALLVVGPAAALAARRTPPISNTNTTALDVASALRFIGIPL